MAKKKNVNAQLDDWRVQDNARMLKQVAMMSSADKKAAQDYLKKEQQAITLACGGKLKK